MNARFIKVARCCWGMTAIIVAGQVTAGFAQAALSEPVRNSERTNQAAAFELKPTAIAPSGAKGSARITPDSITMHLSQLGPGVYEVQVAIGRADGDRKKLGRITIVDPTLSPSRQATDNKKEASANPESVMVETDATLSIPSGVSPNKVARVVVLGLGGNAVLDSKPK
jgi:hypothetical protein